MSQRDKDEDAAVWAQRYAANADKLASQDLAQVADVIRDLERRDRQSRLGVAEQRMLQKARDLRHPLSGGR